MTQVLREGTQVMIGRSVRVTALEIALQMAARKINWGASNGKNVYHKNHPYHLDFLGNDRESKIIGREVKVRGSFLPTARVRIYTERGIDGEVDEFYVDTKHGAATEGEMVNYLSRVRVVLDKLSPREQTMDYQRTGDPRDQPAMH